ncbi:DUF6354 family protein [Streptomyces sp. NPDC055025]
MTVRPAVAEGQLYRDLAPDMKARDRRLRVTEVGPSQATLIVEHDREGTAGRTTRASLARLRGGAFELLEDPADTDPLYLALLAAMSRVRGAKATPADYARAALNVVRTEVRNGTMTGNSPNTPSNQAQTLSGDPWLCEVPWHSHTDTERGPTCRPDTIHHADLDPTPEPQR